MGTGVIYLMIFLLIILTCSTVAFFYSRRKKSLVGQITSSVFVLGVLCLFLSNNIDEWTISKKSVVDDLKHLDLKLEDDFEIASNTVTGMPERYQATEILLSATDKKSVLDNIKHSPNFKPFINEEKYLADTTIIPTSNEGKIINYSHKNTFHREKYSIVDNYPTRLALTLDEKSNKLKYQRIED